MTDCTPPHSEQHERSVIGAVLIKPDLLDDVREILRHEDFYRESNRQIFLAIESLDDRGAPLDAFTVTEELRARGKLETVENGYLAEIADAGIPSRAMDSAYKVKAFAELRELEFQTRVINRECFETIPRDYAEFETFKDSAEQRIFEACERQTRSSLQSLPDVLDDVIQRVNSYASHQVPAGTIRTGFSDLDHVTGGLEPETLTVIAARPSMGKTALAVQIGENAAEAGHAVAILSLEMSTSELAQRLICARARVNLMKVKAGTLGQSERERINKACAELQRLTIWFDDTADQDLQAIRSKARRLARRKNLNLLIIDYLQLVRPRDLRDHRERQISEISRGLKRLAKELHLPVLVVAQLNRLAEARRNHEPQLSDLRESGSIEQDADAVFLLHRPEFYKPKHRPGEADLIIAKQRNGPRKTVPLRFIDSFVRFGNWDETLSIESSRMTA